MLYSTDHCDVGLVFINKLNSLKNHWGHLNSTEWVVMTMRFQVARPLELIESPLKEPSCQVITLMG